MSLFSTNCPYVIDGAMATELERRGADLRHPLWSARMLIEAPEMIEEVHFDYFQAGADIATTASYQATFVGFKAHGLGDNETRALLQLSVELARRARERHLEKASKQSRCEPLVAAAIGPFGAHRHDGSEYTGDYQITDRQLREFHRRQLEVLVDTDADLLAFETVPSLQEGEAIVRLLEEFPVLPAWISFTCEDPLHVRHGDDFARCAALANESTAIVGTGINCTAPEHISPLLAIAAGQTERTLLAYPNSGETWCAEGNGWIGASKSEDIASYTLTWRDAGAKLIGGCCRTGPDTIRQIAETLHS